jgi:NADPH-dependent ferric siderophore reductase
MRAIQQDLEPDGNTRRRIQVIVDSVLQITPALKRITIAGAALAEFSTELPAQWVKVFIPSDSHGRAGRAYTIRSFNKASAQLEIDFVLHGDGLCSSWASAAKAGDTIEIAGPRAGFRLGKTTNSLLIGGDETALPAIASILASLPAGFVVQAYIEVADLGERQDFTTNAEIDISWLPRNGASAGTTTLLQDAIVKAPLPRDGELWVAGEARAIQVIRNHFRAASTTPPPVITASGYWKRGEKDHRDSKP